jgi:hypothetical protein
MSGSEGEAQTKEGKGSHTLLIAVGGPIVTGVFGVIIALIAARCSATPQSPPTQTPTATQRLHTSPSLATVSPSPACPASLQLTMPQNGQQVNGQAGVEITGTACGLATNTGWIFEYDAFDQNYYLVYDPNSGPQPIATNDGPFAILDKPIGDPGDSQKTYVLDAVLATPQCAAIIKAKQSDADGNYVFHPLPPGCQIVSHVDILESQP